MIQANSSGKRAVLFTVVKTEHDDTIFYSGLGLTPNNCTPVSFEECGFTQLGNQFSIMDLDNIRM